MPDSTERLIPESSPAAPVDHVRRWFVSGVFLLLVAFTIHYFFIKTPVHKVYVTNGLSFGYSMEVNGEQFRVGPGSWKKLSVKGEQIAWKVLPEETSSFEASGVIRKTQSQWEKFAHQEHLLVLNPDRTTLIEELRLEYTTEAASYRAKDPIYEYHVGKELYRFRGVDYPFMAFPDEITMEGESEWKKGLAIVHDLPAEDLIAWLYEEERVEDAKIWAIQKIKAEPEKDELIALTKGLWTFEEYVGLMEPVLQERPHVIEAHRAVQDVRMALGEKETLQAEYAEAYQQDPQNPSLMYLHARVMEDNKEADRIFRAAANHPTDPSAHAMYAVSYGAFQQGDVPTASSYLERALAANPESPTFLNFGPNVYWAEGNQAKLMQLAKTRVEEEDHSYPSLHQLMLVQAAFGEEAAAKQTFASLLKLLRDPEVGLDPGDAWSLSRLLESQMFYAASKGEKFTPVRQPQEGAEKDYADFMVAAMGGGYDDCVAYVADLGEEDVDYEFQFVLYRLAKQKGLTEEAQTHKAKCLESLAGLTSQSDAFLATFGSGMAPTVQAVSEFDMHPEFKKYATAIVALEYPQLQPVLRPMQTVWNAFPAFPRTLLAF